MLNRFWQWLVVSSANPDQVSLTVRGWITSVLPMVMFVLHNPNLTSLPDDVYSVVFGALTAVAAVMTVVGFVRKIGMTLFPKAEA